MYSQYAPPHIVTISQRPRQGTSVIDQYQCYGYKHSILSTGGFDTASFSLKVSKAEAEYILDQYMGCVVQINVDDPTMPIFEGYISSITSRPGGLVFTRTLDDMANIVNVTYYNSTSAAVIKTEQTPIISNAASIAIYGAKELSVDAGIHYSNADKTHKTVLRNTYHTERAWPLLTTTVGAGNGELEIEVRGLYDMAWNWGNYVRPSADVVPVFNTLGSVMINTNIISTSTNNPFIYETTTVISFADYAYTYFSLNNSFNIDRQSNSGQTYWQYIQSCTEAGEGVRSYVVGITPRDPNRGNRFAYYRPANPVVKYQISPQDPRLRDLNGAIVPPYLVTPDCGVVFSNMLPGLYTDGNDPSYAYINAVDYNSETFTAAWQSPSDRTMAGVLNRKRYFKAQGTGAFGAVVRQVL